MKKLLVLIILSILLGCSSTQNNMLPKVETQTEASPKLVQAKQKPEFSIESLSEVQRKVLDEIIAPKTRKILEDSEEINLTFGDSRKATVTDKFEKKVLLDSLFEEATQKFPAIDCKPFQQHTIKAEFRGERALVKFDFRCSILYADGFTILHGKNFEKIFTQLIEKYGVGMR